MRAAGRLCHLLILPERGPSGAWAERGIPKQELGNEDGKNISWQASRDQGGDQFPGGEGRRDGLLTSGSGMRGFTARKTEKA